MKSDKDKSKGGCCSFILVLFYLLQPYFYLKFYEKPFLIPQLCAQEWENNIKTTWRTSPGEPGINTLKKSKLGPAPRLITSYLSPKINGSTYQSTELKKVFFWKERAGKTKPHTAWFYVEAEITSSLFPENYWCWDTSDTRRWHWAISLVLPSSWRLDAPSI